MKARVARCDGAICFLVPIELKFHKLFSTISHCDINKSMKMIREIIIKEICSIHKKNKKKTSKQFWHHYGRLQNCQMFVSEWTWVFKGNPNTVFHFPMLKKSSDLPIGQSINWSWFHSYFAVMIGDILDILAPLWAITKLLKFSYHT